MPKLSIISQRRGQLTRYTRSGVGVVWKQTAGGPVRWSRGGSDCSLERSNRS